MKLGFFTMPIHPVGRNLVETLKEDRELAMIDHMAEGRFLMGISPGGLLSDAEVFGNLDADRNAMFVEAVDQILAIWRSDPPYKIKGRYWSVSTERTLMPEFG